jgi:hypothetical protein
MTSAAATERSRTVGAASRVARWAATGIVAGAAVGTAIAIVTTGGDRILDARQISGSCRFALEDVAGVGGWAG